MTGPNSVSLLMAMLIASTACRPAKPIDAMSIPAVCDSTQADPDPTQRGPSLPSAALPSPNHATIVGTVEQAGSRQPLVGGTIDLFPADSTNASSRTRRQGVTSPSAGFILDSIPPGVYVVRARHLVHLPVETRVELMAGRADTVRFVLRRFICSGY